MKQYLDLIEHVIAHGDQRGDRTGTGTIGIFGYQMRFDLRKGFPAVTTKKLAWRAVVSELLWLCEGSTDERRLCEILHGTRDASKKTIWTENAEASYWKPKARFAGDLGDVYGKQWREFRGAVKTAVPVYGDRGVDHLTGHVTIEYETVDQLQNLIDGIKNDPFGRRHIISAWNPSALDDMALPPCHVLSQFYVNSKKELSCHLYQRSADILLGVPFNIASYALLTHMIAAECGLGVGEFVWSGGDCHIYNTHKNAVIEQLQRTPKELPTLKFEKKPFFEYVVSDFTLENYNPSDAIKAEMAV